MDKDNSKQQLKNAYDRIKKYLGYIVKDVLLLFAQITLLLVFLYFLVIRGSSVLRILLYPLFASLMLCIHRFFPDKYKSSWYLAIITLYGSIAYFNVESTNEKNSDTPQKEIRVDSVYYKSIETILELPSGEVFRTNVVESKTVIRECESSYNPILIHYTLGELSVCSPYRILETVDQYNDIINQFEQDSIHFALTPGYVYEEVLRHLCDNNDEDYEVIRERMNKMSEDELLKLFSETEESKSVYDRYHNDYLGLMRVAYFNRGALYDRLGQPEKALNDYIRSKELSKWNVPKDFEYINRAMAYLHLNNYDKAIDILNEGIADIQQNSQELFFYKGYVYLVKKDVEQAINCYKRVVEVDPNYSEAYNYLGLLYYKTGNLNGAIWAFGKAIRTSIRYDANCSEWGYKEAVKYYYNRALVYRELGQNELAEYDEAMVKKYE